MNANISRVREHLARALELHQNGKLQDAERLYQKVLRLKPEHFDALHMLGAIALVNGRDEYAIDLLSRAIRQNARVAAAHWHLGLALMNRERFEEAIQSFERQIELQPDCLDPRLKIASAMSRIGRPDAALACCDRAVSSRPDAAPAHLARAIALKDLEQHERSLEACARAIELDPGSAEAWDKHGAALRDLGRLEEALGSHEKAIDLKPDFSLAYMHAGMICLATGDYPKGWELYEKRAGGTAAHRSNSPRWTGNEPLEGVTLLLHSEQGLGDTIQFCRYARLAELRGARVVLSVPPKLRALLRTLSPTIQVVSETDKPPRFDLQCSLMSLPHAFQTTLESIPWSGPYLSAEPERTAHWREKLGTTGFKVGICWQGSKLPIDVGRSFPVLLFQQLARIAGIRLVSLQKGPGSEQLDSIPSDLRIDNFGHTLDGGADAFLDTAAIMESLDLVITSDTSVAHLAGALGRPTWVVLKRVPDWRWLTEGEHCPWYPSHRLFRQERLGDWPAVFDGVRNNLLRQLGH